MACAELSPVHVAKVDDGVVFILEDQTWFRIHSRHSIGLPPGSDQRNPTLLQVEWGRNTRNQPVTRHGRGVIITEVVNDNDVRSRKKDAETQGRGSRIPQDASRLSASANRCR